MFFLVMSIILRLGLWNREGRKAKITINDSSIPKNQYDFKFEMFTSLRRITVSDAYQVGRA